MTSQPLIAITSSNPPPMVISKLKYQVWSSVLGSSLTTVKTNGDKIETKVFAGGTHIATQMADCGDQIQFHTADPVTGTRGVFVGSSSTGVKEEESEPLGQKIDLTNPGTSYPATYGEVHGMGKDPEWQCAASNLRGSDFLSMPIHCQKKAALNAKWSIPAAFGFSTDEENPQKITHVDSPIPKFHMPGGGSSLSFVLAAAITSSSKPSHADEDDGIDETKLPIDIGEFKVNVFDDSIPGMIDASESGSLTLDGDHSKAQQLPKCLRDFLRPFFPKVQVGNWTTISPVDDARFVPGLPFYVNGKTTAAITLGLYDIHYDSGQVDLTGGQDKSSIGTIAEELAHTTQFIAIWDEQEIKHGPNQSYRLAQSTWQGNYLGESGKIIAKNIAKATISTATGITLPQQDSYRDNKYEKAAQATRKTIQAAVDKLVKSPCYP